jgi:transcription elongation factor GreB
VSKAFTKESDQEEGEVLPPRAPLPPGVRNYITPAGARRLRDELASLQAAPAGRERRIRQLQEIISSLVIAETPGEPDVVRFGATVTVKRPEGVETYRLVGVDEIDLDRNEISWLSPLGKVLLGKRAGNKVRFRAPAGIEEILIEFVSYPAG